MSGQVNVRFDMVSFMAPYLPYLYAVLMILMALLAVNPEEIKDVTTAMTPISYTIGCETSLNSTEKVAYLQRFYGRSHMNPACSEGIFTSIFSYSRTD